MTSKIERPRKISVEVAGGLMVVQTFFENKTCEECNKKGCYTIDLDYNQVPLCIEHIKKSYGSYQVIEG